MSSDFALTFSEKNLIPTDPINKLAISINYYIPEEFTTNPNFWFIEDNWGTQEDYKELLQNFVILQNFYVNKGIPVIIGEVGVLTEEKKEILSIREYLYSVFSLSYEYEGIMACLWDTSNKSFGDMNYYNRLTDEWYDEKIKNIFTSISKGNFVKSSDFYIYANYETISNINKYSDCFINLGTKKPLKIILNLIYSGSLYYDYYFEIYCADRNNWESFLYFDERNGKKQYDGSITYTLDISYQDCYDYIEIYYYFGEIDFKTITVEYQENFTSFFYNDYKAKILNEIN